MRGTIAFVLGFLGTAISFAVAIIILLAWASEVQTFNVAVGSVARSESHGRSRTDKVAAAEFYGRSRTDRVVRTES